MTEFSTPESSKPETGKSQIGKSQTGKPENGKSQIGKPESGGLGGPRGVDVLVVRLDPGLPLPARAHPGDAGVDLYTAIDFELGPGERAVVPTGLAIALPDGYAAFVHPRSGLAAEFGVTMVNTPGTVDAGYRGEIKVIMFNTDRSSPVRFTRGDRI